MKRYGVLILLVMVLLTAVGMDTPQEGAKEERAVKARFTEIIIKVRPGVIVMPEGIQAPPLSEVEIGSEAIKELNSKFNLLSIERLFLRKREGQEAYLDLEDVFLFKFPDLINPDEIIDEYQKLDEVIYAEKNEVVTIF